MNKKTACFNKNSQVPAQKSQRYFLQMLKAAGNNGK